MAITFINKHTDLSIPETIKTSSWMKECIREEAFLLGKLQYTFLNDEDLHKINVDFLNHDTYTDVITFDYNRNNIVFGEIYISLDRIQENAQQNNTTFQNEWHRIVIHGLLHLLGYKDKSVEEKMLMTSKEDYYLSLQPQ